MRKLVLLIAACASLVLSGCATKPPVYSVDDESIRSILIVPVVNETHEVLAGNLMLATMSWPLAERGYYTFPIKTVKMVLEQEGLYEPEQVHQLSAQQLSSMFSADAVLFAKVTFWDSTYVVLTTRSQVTVDYWLVDKHGNELFHADYTAYYQPSNNANAGLIGLLADAIVAAIQRAAPDYIPLANLANQMMINQNFALGPYAQPAKKVQ